MTAIPTRDCPFLGMARDHSPSQIKVTSDDTVLAPTVYGSGSQVDTLRQMRKDRMGELRGLAKNFPEGVQLYGRVVNGGPARQILFAAEETVGHYLRFVTESIRLNLIINRLSSCRTALLSLLESASSVPGRNLSLRESQCGYQEFSRHAFDRLCTLFLQLCL